jgi:hypothetical protein
MFVLPRRAAGIPGRDAHIQTMRNFGIAVLLVVLLSLLAGALWFAFGLWTSLEEADLPLSIYVAMAGGVLVSLAVGIGLMMLVFYSNRHGYDDRAAGRERVD